MELSAFTPWTPWPQRKSIVPRADRQRPGVYALGRFDEGPPPTVDLLAPSILYFGETCDQWLIDRWNQFNRSAFSQKPGHSGGCTFAECFMDDQPGDPPPWLYVSVLPVALESPQAAAYIRYVERRLIWEYVQRHGRFPACNKK